MRAFIKLAPLAAVLMAGPALADDHATNTLLKDGVHVGNGVICDTQDEVATFVKSLPKLGPSNALAAINQQSNNPAACGMATIAFEHGRELANMRTEHGSYSIMQIDIVAAATNDGAWHPVTRQTQYTAVKLEGLEI